MTAPLAHPDPAELAALYIAGAMSSAELEDFESRLLAGEQPYVREFEKLRAASDALSKSVPSVEPGLITRSGLINALGLRKAPPAFAKSGEQESAPDPFAEDDAAMVLLRGSDIDWKDTAVPGVKARNLFVDRVAKRVTVILKLAPGVVYPDHDHPGVEECLVLEGDLELGGKVMHAMDYMRIPKGGQHGTPRTRNGCLLLVTSPLVEAA